MIAGDFNAVRNRGEQSGSLKMAAEQDCRDLISDFFRRSSSHRTDIAVKLKKLKNKLKSWNQNSCENFDFCIRKLENRIDEFEEVGSEGYAALNKDEELKECKLKLWDTMKLHEDTKLRSLFWFKAVKDDWDFNLEDWWLCFVNSSNNRLAEGLAKDDGQNSVSWGAAIARLDPASSCDNSFTTLF
ncbi:hypothetical protein V6N13_095649 [Hibiscus sabdariffa]